MNREQALPYVSFVVDDSGNGREIGADPHAYVRPGNRSRLLTDNRTEPESMCYPSVLVGWQCGFEPLFVAVHSCLDVRLDDDEAEEMAREFLEERGWFAANPGFPTDDDHSADFIIR